MTVTLRIEAEGEIGSGKSAIVNYLIKNCNPEYMVTHIEQFPRLHDDEEIYIITFKKRTADAEPSTTPIE
jgi:Ni2+-binding GTPase involved in maturation of urease and hydrogenase